MDDINNENGGSIIIALLENCCFDKQIVINSRSRQSASTANQQNNSRMCFNRELSVSVVVNMERRREMESDIISGPEHRARKMKRSSI